MPPAGPAANIEVKLTHRRVGYKPAQLHLKPDVESEVVGRLVPGSLVVSLAEVTTESGGTWLRVYHAAAGEGYLQEQGLWRVPIDELAGLGGFELARRPRTVWPEPNRRRGADVTFTCTFNGRIEAFFEAIGSVLSNLDELDSIDSWIIVCDRGSTAEQRSEIMRAMPWATVIGKGGALHGHPASMNMLLSLLRTRWWLQWEDDWRLTPGPGLGFGVLARAREVCSQGIHQVAINGAWLDTDSEHPAGYGSGASRFDMTGGAVNRWVEVLYPEVQRQRILRGDEGFQSLVDGYLSGIGSARGNATSLLWPLYSNQPSLNDSAFMRSLKFNEEIQLPGCYWAFEFDYALQFMRAGGRKASLRGSGGWDGRAGLAEQIRVESSSRETFPGEKAKKASRLPPHYIPITLDPKKDDDAAEGAMGGSVDVDDESRSKFAGGCKIGATPPTGPPTGPPTAPSQGGDAVDVSSEGPAVGAPSGTQAVMSKAPSAVTDAEDGVAMLTAALATKRSTDTVSSTLQELQAVARDGGRVAAREKLVELGFGKIGERLRLEHALMNLVQPVG